MGNDLGGGQVETTRIGVIGTGSIARRRMEQFTDHPSAEVVAVVSRSLDSAREVSDEFGAQAFDSWQAMLADDAIDAVAIATPNTQHFEQTLAALEHGKHVSVEYPLCQTLEEAGALKAAADARGLVLHHGLNVRSEAIYLAALGALPAIGEPVAMHVTYYSDSKWYATPELVGDMFLALHIHFIDYARGFFGEVTALTAATHEAGSDASFRHSGVVLLEHKRCPAVQIEFGMGYPVCPGYSFHVMGTDGLLKMSGGEVTLITAEGDRAIELSEQDDLHADSNNFVARIAEGAEPLRDWDDMTRTMALCLDCTRAARTGVKIAY